MSSDASLATDVLFRSRAARKRHAAFVRDRNPPKRIVASGVVPIESRLFDESVALYERNAKRRKYDDYEALKCVAEQDRNITLHIIHNDAGGLESAAKLEWLTQLKRLFCIQLPKMPNDYVTRIVFDYQHRNLVIHKNGKGIIGGICYRSFPQQDFIEIVFCAITADEQVKGYGTLMMNHLKDYQISVCRIFHFLTYADEYAIGYFKKQGFITQILLPAEQFRGYIKDYQGATLMGCQLHPRIMYSKQKQLFSNMRDLHGCLIATKFPDIERKFGGIEQVFRDNDDVLEDAQIPGFATLRGGASLNAPTAAGGDSIAAYRAVLAKLRADKNAWPFLAPVDADEVPEYYDAIPFPIDLRTIGERVKAGYYRHEHSFLADMKRMFSNCYKFNAPESPYYTHGYRLNEAFNALAAVHFPGAKPSAELPVEQPTVGAPASTKKKAR